MSKPKKTTDNLPYKEFISLLKLLYQLTSNFQELSMRIRSQYIKRKEERTPFEQQSLENNLKKRLDILEDFAQSGVIIYREAVRLQLPTRPDNMLYLALNWMKSKTGAERDDLMERAEAETLQMILEAQAMRTKATSSKAKAKNLTDTEQKGDYSKPMSKTDMMKALGIDSLTKFNGFAKQHGIKKITRKIWQLRLDDLSSREREKIEKA